MNEKELKALFESILKEYGFKKRRYIFFKDFGMFLLRLSFQYSMNSNKYRLNCYFILKEIHDASALSSLAMADISGYQPFKVGDKYVDEIGTDELNVNGAEKIFKATLDELMDLINAEGIGGYLKKHPESIDASPARSIDYLVKLGIILN